MDLSCSPIHSPFPLANIHSHINGFGSNDITLRSSSRSPAALSTLLVLLFGSIGDVSSVITNVSVIQSWRWFMHLSPFESVALFFIIVEIGILVLLGMLPINFTELWQGEPAGRKRRRRRKRAFPEADQHVAFREQEIGTKLLALYKKLDQNECGLRALCELQRKVKKKETEGRIIPSTTRLMLRTLQKYAAAEHETGKWKRSSVDVSPAVQLAIKPYAEAVKMGSLPEDDKEVVTSSKAPVLDEYYYGRNVTWRNSEGTICQRKYSACPVTSDEIMEYIGRIHFVKS